MEHAATLRSLWVEAEKGAELRPRLHSILIEKPRTPGRPWKVTIVATIRDVRAKRTGFGASKLEAENEALLQMERHYRDDHLLDYADISPEAH